MNECACRRGFTHVQYCDFCVKVVKNIWCSFENWSNHNITNFTVVVVHEHINHMNLNPGYIVVHPDNRYLEQTNKLTNQILYMEQTNRQTINLPLWIKWAIKVFIITKYRYLGINSSSMLKHSISISIPFCHCHFNPVNHGMKSVQDPLYKWWAPWDIVRQQIQTDLSTFYLVPVSSLWKTNRKYLIKYVQRKINTLTQSDLNQNLDPLRFFDNRKTRNGPRIWF